MTKKELIELLANYPDDAIIFVPGHSDGSDYEEASEPKKIEVFEKPGWDWAGSHSDSEYYAELGKPKISGILIS